MNTATLMEFGWYLPLGIVLGAAYFGLLMRTVRLYADGASAIGIVPLYAVRIGIAIGAFWAVAQQGALSLLLTLAGFLIARYVMTRRWGLT